MWHHTRALALILRHGRLLAPQRAPLLGSFTGARNKEGEAYNIRRRDEIYDIRRRDEIYEKTAGGSLTI